MRELDGELILGAIVLCREVGWMRGREGNDFSLLLYLLGVW